MSNKSQHVIPNKDGGWSVRKVGSARVTRIFDSFKEAIDYARQLAKKEQSELYVHRKDGTIKSKDTFSSDSDTLPAEEKE